MVGVRAKGKFFPDELLSSRFKIILKLSNKEDYGILGISEEEVNYIESKTGNSVLDVRGDNRLINTLEGR